MVVPLDLEEHISKITSIANQTKMISSIVFIRLCAYRLKTVEHVILDNEIE